MFRDLMLKNRSYRRFDESRQITEDELTQLVDLARVCPSAANLQPLRYVLSFEPKINAEIFPSLAWAGYLKGLGDPPEGERPTAYIIILADKTVQSSMGADLGIAAQSILLGATEMGLGGCMVGSIKRDELRGTMGITDAYEVLLVIALGKPKETVALEEVGESGSIHYYRTPDAVHHVPKRTLKDIVLTFR